MGHSISALPLYPGQPARDQMLRPLGHFKLDMPLLAAGL
jgi:hypothetical protein